jgi:hypothetical protein
VGQCPNGVAGVGRHDCHEPGFGDARGAGDRHLEEALDDVPDLLLRMLVLLDDCAFVELVAAERHMRRVEVAPIPAALALDDRKFARIDNSHPINPPP